jgi:hypothetical protein
VTAPQIAHRYCFDTMSTLPNNLDGHQDRKGDVA